MKQEITNITLQFVCNKNWDNMADAANGKYCHSCKKMVYDFTNAKQNEFLAIMSQNNNNVCGMFKSEQLAPSHTIIPIWKKMISAAMILVGINLFNSKTQAQAKPITVNDQQTITDTNRVFGMINTMDPKFPGGIDAFLKFVSDNIQYKKGIIDGRVILSFTVKKDGSLSDIKAVRGVSPANSEEAVRILTLSPKWLPAINSGKSVDVFYSIPIMFKRKD